MNIVTWLRKRPGAPEWDGPLSGIPIFEGLSRRERRWVAQMMRHRTCPPGTPIFHEGERDERLYVVLEGRVQILRAVSEIPPACLGPGEFFGETALIAEFPRSASAVPLDPVHLLSLSRSDFVRLCDRHPHIGVQIAIHLSQVIAERLRQTNHLLKEAQTHGPQTEEAEVPEESEILRHRPGGQT